MSIRLRTIVAGLLTLGVVTACGDAASPTQASPASSPALSGGTTTGGGGTSTGGGTSSGGGSRSSTSCGVFGPITTGYVVVYTTRQGIGFDGTITNCGTSSTSFVVDVQDTTPDLACAVQVPHYIAPHNTGAGSTSTFSATSTRIPCTGIMHNFLLTLRDVGTGAALATATSSAFR